MSAHNAPSSKLQLRSSACFVPPLHATNQPLAHPRNSHTNIQEPPSRMQFELPVYEAKYSRKGKYSNEELAYLRAIVNEFDAKNLGIAPGTVNLSVFSFALDRNQRLCTSWTAQSRKPILAASYQGSFQQPISYIYVW